MRKMTIKTSISHTQPRRKWSGSSSFPLMGTRTTRWDWLLTQQKSLPSVAWSMENFSSPQELMICASICGKLTSQFLLRVFMKNLRIIPSLNFLKEVLMDKSWVISRISFTTVKSDQKMNIPQKPENLMEKFPWVLLPIWWEVWDSIQPKNKLKICKIKSDIATMSITIKKLLANWNFKPFWNCLSTTDPSMESLKTISLQPFLFSEVQKEVLLPRWVDRNLWKPWQMRDKRWPLKNLKSARRSFLAKEWNSLKKLMKSFCAIKYSGLRMLRVASRQEELNIEWLDHNIVIFIWFHQGNI